MLKSLPSDTMTENVDDTGSAMPLVTLLSERSDGRADLDRTLHVAGLERRRRDAVAPCAWRPSMPVTGPLTEFA